MSQHRNVERVIEAGAGVGLTIEPRTFPDGTRTATDAAAAVGVDVGQIVKSLVFLADGEADSPLLALVSGDHRADEELLAAHAGCDRVGRADADAVREATGYPIGGVPPFGHPEPIRTFVDRHLLDYAEVWAAAGTPRDVFPIAPDALVQATAGVVMDLAASG